MEAVRDDRLIGGRAWRVCYESTVTEGRAGCYNRPIYWGGIIYHKTTRRNYRQTLEMVYVHRDDYMQSPPRNGAMYVGGVSSHPTREEAVKEFGDITSLA